MYILCRYDLMLQCWQEELLDRPSFPQLRSSFSAMLQVNEEAPYYQIRDDDQRETCSDGSVSSIDKQKKPKEKLKRKVTNPYVPTFEQGQQGQVDGEGYIAIEGAESALERPAQLGIPISQLVPVSSSSQNVE